MPAIGSLEKCCFHTVCESFFVQTQRLEAARYPDSELVAVSQIQKKWVKRNGEAVERGQNERKRKKYTVVPYGHHLSHGLIKECRGQVWCNYGVLGPKQTFSCLPRN